MGTFDFNQFQRDIFKTVFKDPLEKAPESNFVFECSSVLKASATKTPLQEVKKPRGRPIASFKRKLQEKCITDESEIEEEPKTPKRTLKEESKQIPQVDEDEEVDTIKMTQFELFKKNEALNKAAKNCRRSRRAKVNTHKNVAVTIEIIDARKEINEMTQEEFLYYFAMKRID